MTQDQIFKSQSLRHDKNSDTRSNFGDGTGDFALWDRSKSKALSKKEKTSYNIGHS